MGKKSRAKLQRQQAARNSSKPTAKANPIVAPVMSTALGSKLAAPSQSRAVAQADYSYVRSDIKRILLLLLVVVVLLLCGVIINTRSTALRTAGSKVAGFLQLQ